MGSLARFVLCLRGCFPGPSDTFFGAPSARIKDQDLDKVQAKVIYTSMGMLLDNVELRAACFRAYERQSIAAMIPNGSCP